jgi:prevent-host-death family protein
MATRIIPKTELRERIRKELSALGHDTLVVTEHGRPVAVAVSIQRWNELQASLEDLQDAVAVLEHRLSRRKGRSAEAVFATIEAEEADVRRPDRKTG